MTAIGFAPHTGSAVAVVIDGRTVVDKCRIEIGPASIDRQVFHAAEGRHDAAAIVERGVREANDAAAAAIEAFGHFGITRAGIVGEPRSLPALDRILASHLLLHAAEGDLYREVLEDACAAQGWTVVQAHAKALKAEADTWKGASPSPWQADHRLAAAVAARTVAA